MAGRTQHNNNLGLVYRRFRRVKPWLPLANITEHYENNIAELGILLQIFFRSISITK